MSTIKSSSEHLTINADGTGKEVKIQRNGTQVMATTASGIDVTGSVTTDGLLFNGDTAAANSLDDYEEGNWSMSIIGASGSAGAWAQAGVVARYTKIGRIVHFSATGYLTNLGSYTGTSAIQITGLPFVSDSIDVAASASSIPIGQYNSTNYVPQVQGGTTHLNIRKNQYGASTAIYNEQTLNIPYNISGTYNIS